MNNTVCRNFNYKERADGILELISLNCGRCEFDGHCDIKTAYHNAKDYVALMEIRGCQNTNEKSPILKNNVVNGECIEK